MKLIEISENETYSIVLNYNEYELLEEIVKCIIEYINAIGYKATCSINNENEFELKLFAPKFTTEYVKQQLEFEYSIYS